MRTNVNIHTDLDEVITASVEEQDGFHWLVITAAGGGRLTVHATLDQLETLCDSLVGELAAARHAEHLAAMEPIPFLPTSLVDEQPGPFAPLQPFVAHIQTGGVSTPSSAASSDLPKDAA